MDRKGDAFGRAELVGDAAEMDGSSLSGMNERSSQWFQFLSRPAMGGIRFIDYPDFRLRGMLGSSDFPAHECTQPIPDVMEHLSAMITVVIVLFLLCVLILVDAGEASPHA